VEKVIETKQNQILKFIMESDMEFFEHFLSDLNEKELQSFFDNNPEFLQQ